MTVSQLFIQTSSYRQNKSVQEDAVMTVSQIVDSDLFMKAR